jgi:hypothetical protein
MLSSAGYAPDALGITNGYMVTRFVNGMPLTVSDVTGDFLDRAASYLGFRQSFQASGPVQFDSILRMLHINTAGLREDLSEVDALRPLIEAGQIVEVDGRMLPHEWIRTSTGYLKTDGIDHHDDHFFPGPQDIAWDLAGLCVEFHLSHLQCGRLGYATLSYESVENETEKHRFHLLVDYYAQVVKTWTPGCLQL